MYQQNNKHFLTLSEMFLRSCKTFMVKKIHVVINKNEKQKNLETSKKLSVCCKGTFSYHKGYTVSSINDKKMAKY